MHFNCMRATQAKFNILITLVGPAHILFAVGIFYAFTFYPR